jgi:1-acyl-sn-glycerol-3-phosphate acyltransferase
MRSPAARSRAWRAASRAAGTLGLAAATALRLRCLGAEADPARRSLVLQDGARRVLELHGLGVSIEGPVPAGPALLAANHVSWLDPLVVASSTPCIPVSKADVSSWPVIGGLARDLGVVFHARGDVPSGARVMRAAEDALRRGLPVLNFPEGTTTDGRTVGPFRRGLFGLARRAGVPVVPVALAYFPTELAWTGDQTFLPHWLRLAAGPGGLAFLRFGLPLAAGALDAEALAGAARARVLDLLGGPRAAAVCS